MSKLMVMKPRVSEKAYGLSQSGNVYVMQVPSDATKLTVASAIQAQFGAKVKNVNVMVVKGKTKRTVRRGGRQKFGTRSDMKKAYVTLVEGESLPIFVSEEDKKPEKPKTKAGRK